MLTCPNCKATHIVKYGKTRSGTQSYKCRECARRFVENPTKKYISQETWAQVDKLLTEKLSLSGIARVTGISGTWLQAYVNRLYEKLRTTACKKRRWCLECDEMWSFVGKSQEKVWIWLALEVVGVAFGKRDTEGAQALWNSLPAVYRQCAVCYTDFWEAYKKVFPSKRHKAVGKETGLTNHIEDLTIR